MEQVADEEEDPDKLINLKIFKIYRESTDEDNQSGTPLRLYSRSTEEEMCSLNDLACKNSKYLTDKVFQINFNLD